MTGERVFCFDGTADSACSLIVLVALWLPFWLSRILLAIGNGVLKTVWDLGKGFHLKGISPGKASQELRRRRAGALREPAEDAEEFEEQRGRVFSDMPFGALFRFERTSDGEGAQPGAPASR